METNDSTSSLQPSLIINSQAKLLFDALTAHIAIVDETGKILETNAAWQDFARKNGMPGGYDPIGKNYLSVCDSTTGEDESMAKRIAEGIRKVISGEMIEFKYDYPCHSDTEKRWFYFRAIRIPGVSPIRLIVSHENITELKLAEEALRRSREESETHRQHLEEMNIALKVLLKQRELDRAELEKSVLGNIKELIFPFLDKLKNSNLKAREKEYVHIISDHLDDIIAPFTQRLSNMHIFLTPQEMQIASLVKDGKSSQEISDILNISEATVSFHRKNLRKKFGLNKKSGNLRTHLMALSK